MTPVKTKPTGNFEVLEENRKAINAIDKASNILCKFDIPVPSELSVRIRETREVTAGLVHKEAVAALNTAYPDEAYRKLQLLKPYL